jgi:hypothetical protein
MQDAVSYIENELIVKEKKIVINTVIAMELLSHKDVDRKQSVREIFLKNSKKEE